MFKTARWLFLPLLAVFFLLVLGQPRNRELLWWALGRRRRFRVVENSMLPTLRDGDEVVVQLAGKGKRPFSPGDIIIAQHPLKEMKMIKRVDKVLEDGRLFVLGDNLAESSDSRAFGAISPQLVIGRVTCKF